MFGDIMWLMVGGVSPSKMITYCLLFILFYSSLKVTSAAVSILDQSSARKK
jgi:hypothetical protein